MKIIKVTSALTIVLASTWLTAFSTNLQALEPKPAAETYVLPKVAVHRIQSRFVGQEFEVHVAMPPVLAGGNERFPVMYLTDSNTEVRFGGISTMLQFGGDVPRFISVGIGYPVDHVLGGLSVRSRDLTPTAIQSTTLAGIDSIPVSGILKPTGKTTGGGPEFLRFIREELIPMIDAQYPTVTGDRAYSGHSLGGLFGLYVLFNAPDTFQRYVISSPSIWWDDDAILKQAQAYVDGHTDLPARVYMAAGALEEVMTEMVSYRMVTNMYRVQSLLKSANFPGLSLQVHTFPDETHTSVSPMVYIRGVKAVYDQPPVSFAMKAVLDKIQAEESATNSK